MPFTSFAFAFAAVPDIIILYTSINSLFRPVNFIHFALVCQRLHQTSGYYPIYWATSRQNDIYFEIIISFRWDFFFLSKIHLIVCRFCLILLRYAVCNKVNETIFIVYNIGPSFCGRKTSNSLTWEFHFHVKMETNFGERRWVFVSCVLHIWFTFEMCSVQVSV